MVFVSDAIQKFYYSRYGAITRRPWRSYGSRSAARVRNANQMTGLRNYEYRVILCGLMKFLQGFLCVLYISSLTIYYYETVRITPRFDGNRFPGICLAVFFFLYSFSFIADDENDAPDGKGQNDERFRSVGKKKDWLQQLAVLPGRRGDGTRGIRIFPDPTEHQIAYAHYDRFSIPTTFLNSSGSSPNDVLDARIDLIVILKIVNKINCVIENLDLLFFFFFPWKI